MVKQRVSITTGPITAPITVNGNAPTTVAHVVVGGHNFQIVLQPQGSDPPKKRGRKRKPLPENEQGRFAANLLRLREAAGLSVAEAAEKIGTARTSLTGWEAAESAPSVEWIPKIAAAYSTTIESLFKIK